MAALIRLLYGAGYAYVENLTWVQMAPNNTVVTAPAAYAQRSHLTLFIFRRAGAGTAAHGVHACMHASLLLDGLDKGPLHAGLDSDGQVRHAEAIDAMLLRWNGCTGTRLVPTQRVQRVVRHACAGEGKDIELRHQRNPDVLFDCVQRQCGAAAASCVQGCAAAAAGRLPATPESHARPPPLGSSVAHHALPWLHAGLAIFMRFMSGRRQGCKPAAPAVHLCRPDSSHAGGGVCGDRDAAADRAGQLPGAVGAAGSAKSGVEARGRGGPNKEGRLNAIVNPAGNNDRCVNMRIYPT